MVRGDRRGASALAVAAALGAALSGCTGGPAATPSPTPPPPSGDGVLRIGTLFTTSGDGAASAAGLTAAVHAAVREIDAAGGVLGASVEVISRNGGTAGDGTAEASFAELVERGVDVVIGPSTMDLARLLVPLADQAGVALITPAATGVRPDGTAGLFRTVPAAGVQAAALGMLLTQHASRIAVIRTDDDAGQALAAGLADGLTGSEGPSGSGTEIVADVILGGDPAAVAQQLGAVAPDAVLVSPADAGPATADLLAALTAAGLGGDALWIAGAGLARYPAEAGPLDGAHGIQSTSPTDAAFIAQVRQEDPGARTLQNAAAAYDAVVLAALAATLAGDDGGASIAAFLRAAAGDGIRCRSFGECGDVLRTESDIDYDGASGSFRFDDAGDRPAGEFARYRYDAGNAPVLDATAG